MHALFDRPYLMLCLVSLFWGGNMVLGRAVIADLPPVTLAFARWAGALLLALPFAWKHLQSDWPAIRRSWPLLLTLGITGVGLYNTMAYNGLRHTQAINGLLMQSSTPIFAMLWVFALFGDRPTWRQMMGIALSTIGIIVIACHGKLADLLTLNLNSGDLWIIAGLVVYTFYMALVKKRPAMHGLSFFTVTCAIGALTQVLLYPLERAAGLVANFTPLAVLVMVYAMIFPGFLAYLFFNRSLELIGANRAAPFSHLTPVFGTTLAVVFLGEQFALFHAVGIALVGSGIIVASHATSR